MIFDQKTRILVTGANGMVGKAVVKVLSKNSNTHLLCPNRKELDLRSKTKVFEYFESHKPDYVFMIAAKVGGIKANMDEPVAFLNDNLKIQLNLFEACYKYKPKKNMFIGSSCIYPKNCPQPMKEEYLLTGKLEPTNEGYALAKIIGLKMAEYYYQKHGMITVCPMVCNIYGTNDNFNLNNSHVLSAMIKRFVDAKKEGVKQVELWGTGTPTREFIHVDDVARGLIYLIENVDDARIINLGTGNDISIKALSHLISKIVKFEGKIIWDTSKPDGMQKKCLDVSVLNNLGFKHKIELEEGIQQTVSEYRNILKREL